jgi:hypothetical protein
MRRLPSSRLIWFGPSPSSMVAIFDSGMRPVRRLDQDLAQAFDGARRFGQLHHQREAPAALDDLGHLLALDQCLQRRQHLRRRHAVLRRRGVVDAHLDLRCQHLLLDLQVGNAGDGGQLRTQGIGLAAQRVQVLAEDLDRDLRAHAREHVVDAVRDRLADLEAAGRLTRRLRMSALISSMLRVSSAVGLRPTSSSLTCTPSACSSSSARPLRRPT